MVKNLQANSAYSSTNLNKTKAFINKTKYT